MITSGRPLARAEAKCVDETRFNSYLGGSELRDVPWVTGGGLWTLSARDGGRR